MKLEFFGAARNVTGSKHLLHVNGKKILLDCGLFQGRRKEAIEANLHFPFDPSELECVVLSHAHIDHSGALPLLVKKGFTGKIYCTTVTRDLCEIMLRDSAYIQEKDAEWMQKKLKTPDAEPLYTIADAERTLLLFHPVEYDEVFSPAENIKVKFHDAGHILGAAVEEWVIEDKDLGKTVRLGFTGDLGRHHLPILKDPVQLEDLDLLITESTYGSRHHDEIENVEEKLAKELSEAIARGGKIIIPSFAVGRTQEVLFIIRELVHQKKIPPVPIFVDSPLAIKATEVFDRHPECYDSALREMIDRGENPFSAEQHGVQFTVSVDESKALNNFPGPAIIISASGMCEAGRIRHHLINTITDEKNLLLVVGYMAENTLGRKLVEGVSPVNIFGEPYEVNAEVKIYNAFSAHADQDELLKFAQNIGKAKSLFLVHGEDSALIAFQEKLRELDNIRTADIHIPTPGDIFEITKDKTWKKVAENPDGRNILGGEWEDLG
jgi:metallo-beta-lactamase family protein